jgi:hypothetical protein
MCVNTRRTHLTGSCVHVRTLHDRTKMKMPSPVGLVLARPLRRYWTAGLAVANGNREGRWQPTTSQVWPPPQNTSLDLTTGHGEWFFLCGKRSTDRATVFAPTVTSLCVVYDMMGPAFPIGCAFSGTRTVQQEDEARVENRGAIVGVTGGSPPRFVLWTRNYCQGQVMREMRSRVREDRAECL